MNHKLIDNPDDFKSYVQGYLRKHKRLQFGYNNGYYWEEYWIREAENKYGEQGLKVVFNIGSESGYKPCQRYSEFVTWDEFRYLVYNKKFEDADAKLIDIIGKAAYSYK